MNNEIIPVCVLTYRRPRYLVRTLDSFVEKNAAIMDRFSFRVLVQGGRHYPTEKVLEQRSFFIERIEVSPENTGGGGGFTRLMQDVIKKTHRFVLYLEDDWESTEPLVPHLDEIMDFLSAHPHVGQIRLRSVLSPVSKTNPISGAHIFWEQTAKNITSGNAHFTFNPAITRVSVLPQIIPCKNEKEACRKYHSLKLDCAQLQANCFNHIGAERATAERAVL